MKYLLLLLITCLLIGSSFADTSERRSSATLALDYQDIDIRELLIDVAKQAKLNVAIPDTLKGAVSIKVRDVTWMQVYTCVLEPAGYTWVDDGQMVEILPVRKSGHGPRRPAGPRGK